ncbi:sarcosine oxidase subunit alpha family protein [Pseudooceanicola sediminis]|uniref:Sarcosine oxidase subunit alpha family protein n=1 Tax=Pseudooceanicola sediminis TaxID=2211117 RepID=A0A399J160_9RHOB|nr:sarcosine oxidase subunit alpha family protein [Pseudooceanicola sediminis]KAA2316258.1 sarcosine oxidase subunit alpha family protein [Puniceibacterium sp. HSS470]RII39168.1 sarcosine oxidase subunit alpha family protein [Pseudooceanicola sediminis]|tara:strand:+ start:74618 stop:77551 length:2934 start_codon:yes stop_codon:yes gene_type:complete
MRLSHAGLVERSRPIRFRFDGRDYTGFQGDTLASALMAHGVRTVARSFKYHRPRGIFSAGSEEPNALVTIGAGAGREPNVRATTQELFAGLEARAQNCWPSVDWDLLQVNDLLADFLGAGFYYKTFMWPKKAWEAVYEPLIRRAAGIGALSGAPDPDLNEKAFAHCDLLVIGAGPAGLMAAQTAARAGADVILCDEDAMPGGRLNAEVEQIGGQAAHDWAAQTVAQLREMANVRVMTRTTVTGIYDQGTFGALERVSRHVAPGRDDLPLDCFWRIAARQVILAAGSIERPVAFRNNDRPGVMLAGAVRTYLNRYAVSPGRAVTVFGNNDNVHRTARDLLAAGVHVAALVDARPGATTDLPVPFYAGAMVEQVLGQNGVEAVVIRTATGRQKIQSDCVAVSGGWNPSVHLTCHLNGRPEWDSALAAFVPAPGAVPNLIPAGAASGVFSTDGCLRSGASAAVKALAALGRAADAPDIPLAEAGSYDIVPLWQVPGPGRAWLDLHNDVTVKDVRTAAAENFRSVEHMKRYTTQGMAPDQGKTSNLGALAVLADVTGRDVPQTGTTTYRPPFVPVPIAALGAGGRGQGFAPRRRTSSHDVSLSMNAPMIETGLWYRPSHFPRRGEATWRQSCDREVAMVRNAVGVCDVSTLGKIDIQGADAAKFLEFVYTNTFSTLKEGRVRYGLMLREDGHVMDDGTTACLGPQHYLMTTTTAAAGLVMQHLEFAAQVLRPDWDVRLISVTEQWAQFAIAGPQARALLADLVGQDVSNAAFPFMSCGPVTLAGVTARLFRISFSGELGYELAVPARYGESLYRLLVARAEALGGGAYGLEALNILRLEKGFLTHAELDGRTTAFDLGLERMMSPSKEFIGKAAATRPGLVADDRARLVALKPVGPVRQLTAGAFLFEEDAEPIRQNAQGHVSSVGFSPTVGHFIGLAFLKNGPDRFGDRVIMVDHLRGITALCEVCDPVFHDPEGGRSRG